MQGRYQVVTDGHSDGGIGRKEIILLFKRR